MRPTFAMLQALVAAGYKPYQRLTATGYGKEGMEFISMPFITDDHSAIAIKVRERDNPLTMTEQTISDEEIRIAEWYRREGLRQGDRPEPRMEDEDWN
jgi:hypothetical protein